jgi:hypothetical protein
MYDQGNTLYKTAHSPALAELCAVGRVPICSGVLRPLESPVRHMGLPLRAEARGVMNRAPGNSHQGAEHEPRSRIPA